MYNPIMRTRSVLSLLVLAVGMSGVSLRAQDSWVARPSGTTANLWSVAFAANQWVAVGEQGTILTSPDGTAWTTRSSGFPTRWIVSVGYGAGTWTAVGESGLILTSADAITWTPRTSGTTARLNGVAYGGGRWMIVAESGELLTSTDSLAWTKLSPSTDRLRGLIFAYGQFVITGDNGLVRTTIDATDYAAKALPGGFFVESVTYARRAFVAVGEDGYAITSSDATTWTTLASGTTAYLRGITFFNGQFIAVGTAGTIVTTPAPGSTWTARVSSSTATLTAVAASDASVVTVGSGGTILRSVPVTAAPAIAVSPRSVTEVAGSNVLLSVTAIGSPPLTYQWSFNGQPLTGQNSDQLFLSNVQSAQAGNYAVTVTNPFGSVASTAAVLQLAASNTPRPIVDSTFAPTLIMTAGLNAAVEQPDGKVIIGGSQFFVTAGVSPFALARLNVDGSLDATFNIGVGLNTGGSIAQLVLQPDGRVIVSGTFQTINNVARPNLARLNSDGSVDTTFIPAASASSNPNPRLSLQADGKILLLSGTRLLRLNSDGGLDPSFTAPSSSTLPASFALLNDGRILLCSASSIQRLNKDGTVDATYTSNFGPTTAGPSLWDIQTSPDGRVFYQLRRFVIASNVVSVGRLTAEGLPDPSWKNLESSNRSSSSTITIITAADARGYVYAARNVFQNTPGRIERSIVRYKPDSSLDSTFDNRTTLYGGVPTALTTEPNGDITCIYPLIDGRALVTGAFTTFDGASRPNLVRLVSTTTTEIRPPTIVSLTPDSASVAPGSSLSLSVTAAGSGPLTYAWNGVILAADSGKSTVSIPTNISGTYTATVTVSNRSGSVKSAPVRIVVTPSIPILTAAPASLTVTTGRTAVFNVAAAGSAPFTYQWFRGTTPVGTGSTLTFNAVTATDAGDYTVVVTNSLGSTRSSVAKLTVDSSARLANISTRAGTGPGDSTLIAGFVITGASAKKVLIRGIGPSLSAFGLGGLLPNPKITLYDGDRRVIATNDDFISATTPNGLAPGVSGFPLSNPTDAALVATLTPGNYTVQVTDSAARSGVALVEVYAADTTDNRISSLSTRAFVGAGPAIGICGITVEGERPRQFLIRAVGPTLSVFNVGNTLPDPLLTLTTASGVPVASNDNWGSVENGAQIAAATAAVGAFALPAASKDSALLITLAPGNYTALISGVNDVTGVAIIEVYEMPLAGP
jgi:uncharacterized delta-60 repeat protein